jgi:cytochrome c oxidase assembly protein subunit 11
VLSISTPNRSSTAIIGHAAYTVAPETAAHYFSKAGLSVDMPVSCFVAPEILKNHRNDNPTQITLSFTFYPATHRNQLAKTAALSDKGPGC